MLREAALSAMILVSSGSAVSQTAQTEDGFLMNTRLDMSDLVSIARVIDGDGDMIRQHIRYDMNLDGLCDSADFELACNAVFNDDFIFDVVMRNPILDDFRYQAESWFCLEFDATPSEYYGFYGFYPSQILPYNTDKLCVETVVSIAVSENRGRIISNADPWFTAIGYEESYPAGTVVVSYIAYERGAVSADYIADRMDFVFGSAGN